MAWGGRGQADFRARIEACVAAGLATPGRIAVAGQCYGGFSRSVAITGFADLVNAAILTCGMYRRDSAHDQTGTLARDYARQMMGGTPEELPAKDAAASLANFIDAIKGSVLIVHGLADSTVGPENSMTAIRDLTAAGIPHEVLLFADEEHGISRRGNLAEYLARTVAFLERALG